MTISLAIESSSSVGSVALVRDGEILNEISFECPRGRGGSSSPRWRRCLLIRRRSIRSWSASGREVIMASAPRSLSPGGSPRLEIFRSSGVPSLLGLAGSEYFAVGDARGGHFYFAHIREGEFLVFPEAIDEKQVMERLAEAPSLPVYVPAPVTILPRGSVVHPVASRLGERSTGFAPSESIPEPLYLKPPKITEPRERKSYLK